MMEKERERIERMLREGKISKEQSEKLLKALEESTAAEKERRVRKPKTKIISISIAIIALIIAGGLLATHLPKIKLQKKINREISQLGTGDRFKALNTLIEIGEPAVPALIEALQDKSNPFTRRWEVAKALGAIKDERAVEPLIKAMSDENEVIRRVTAEALGRLGDKRAIPILKEALKDPKYYYDEQTGRNRYYTRESAAEALEKLGIEVIQKDDKYIVTGQKLQEKIPLPKIKLQRKVDKEISQLTKALNDKVWTVRQAAAESLGNVGDERAVDSLIKALNDKVWKVRQSAAEALGNIGDERAVDSLTKALNDPVWTVRQAAAEALGNIGDKKAVDPLIKALNDKVWKVRRAAAEALGKIKSKTPEHEKYSPPKKPAKSKEKQELTPKKETKTKGKILIFIKPDLYNSLRLELKTYLKDIEKDGYSVEVKTKDWETANEIKNILKQEWKTGLQGCILIGDIPYALIKRSEEEEEEGEEDVRPCPLFYMDLDGKWTDSGNNGYYDIFPDWPEIAPEIWVGRITAHTLDGEETLRIKNYFKKVHLYRRGMLQVKKNALSFVDDKWARRSKRQTLGLDKIYGTGVVILNDKEVSTAERFKAELKKEYEFIHVITHNNRGYTGHGFKENSSLNKVSFEDIQEIRPKALFYNLGVCSNCCFIKDNYMGGWYLFGPGNGLMVIGTTMPGMMLSVSFFYDCLSKGESFGESLKKWYKKEIPRDRKATNRKWYLGIVLLGDPTLVIQKVAKPREEPKPKEKPESKELTQEDKAKTIYSLGENYRLNKMYPQAIKEYEKLIKEYPKTTWAEKASQRIKEIKAK